MYNVKNASIFKNWDKDCYIATKTQEQVEYDDYGNEIRKYNKPQKYRFNIQPVNGYLDIVEYGDRVEKLYRAIIPYEKYKGNFKAGDVAYLEGKTPDDETEDTYGMTANFVITSVRPQNVAIAVYFERLPQ